MKEISVFAWICVSLLGVFFLTIVGALVEDGVGSWISVEDSASALMGGLWLSRENTQKMELMSASVSRIMDPSTP